MKILYLGLLALLASAVHCSSLHDAAVAGDADLVKQLLDSKKYDVNEKDAQGRTPLAAAMATCTQSGTVKYPKSPPNGELNYCPGGANALVVDLLICAGADVDAEVYPKQHPGYKLIHQAICNEGYLLYSLLTAGADPNTPYKLPGSKKAVTPLTWGAMCAGELKKLPDGPDYFTFEALIQAGANPLPDGPNNPPSALVYPKPQPFSKCNTLEACTNQDVQKLSGAARDDFEDKDKKASGFPADFDFRTWKVLWAAQENAHADPTSKPEPPIWLKRGMEYSCGNAKEKYQQMVDQRNKTAQAQTYKTKYPLHAAVAANNMTAVKEVLDSGRAQVNDKDDKGLTPLQVGLSCTAPIINCWPDADPGIAAYLASKGANVNLDISPRASQPQGPGHTLLHWAASLGWTTTVKALIEGGADVNAIWFKKYQHFPPEPMTPLILAAHCDSRMNTHDNPGPESTNSTIQALLDAGANPLPFGKDKPLTGEFLNTPTGAKKCFKIGACTESEVEKVIKTFDSGTCPQSFLLAWKAQDKLVNAAAAKKGSRRLKVADGLEDLAY